MIMNKEGLGVLLQHELEKTIQNSSLSISRKYFLIYEWFLKLVDVLIAEEKLQFTTLFAKIAYLGHKYNLPTELQHYLHLFRQHSQKLYRQEPDETDVRFAAKVLSEALFYLLDAPPSTGLSTYIPESWPFAYYPIDVKAKYASLRVLLLEGQWEKKILLGKESEHPEKIIQIRFGVPGINDAFNSTIQEIKNYCNFPITVNLLDVLVDQSDSYIPSAFVIEPDFLVDVSAVSECFSGNKAAISRYLLKKFWPFSTSQALMLGNISNFFLDELIINPNSNFKNLFIQLFQVYPLAFCLMDDAEVRKLYEKAQLHYVNLKKVLLQDIEQEGLELSEGIIEPSFYSEQFGLQGRLDLFFERPKPGIIELKSGRIYNPNIHGLGQSHFVQTLLYDLLIQSVYQNQLTPANYLLYSGVEDRPLRFVPKIKAQQNEALQFRNQIIIIEKRLASIFPEAKSLAQGMELFNLLTLSRNTDFAGFERNNIYEFETAYSSLSVLEKKYFLAFTGLIAREHQLAKTGAHGNTQLNGQAALWLDALEEKLGKFGILNHLEFEYATISDQHDHFIYFSKSTSTEKLANFREGDIAVLYPDHPGETPVLRHQIFKCTIVSLNNTQAVVRLRSKQTNESTFLRHKHWHLEHDMMDNGFTTMYRSLFAWAKANTNARRLLLGIHTPGQLAISPLLPDASLTDEQQKILKNALQAKDYYLLWGPPGTGKTSVMLRHLVQYYFNETNQNLLIMAYTNRAVDEICESIHQIHPSFSNHYFRVGSAFSTNPEFRSQLLKFKSKEAQNRKALKDLIDAHRIVVGTVASIMNQPELFELKHFNTAIIDEASQILEPLLMGILPKFEKFILIGDHKQLPAVVAQNEVLTTVEDIDLLESGFKNLRNSLFERMFKTCIKNEWTWCYDQLSCQGRMHIQLMQFPSAFFYGGHLKVLPESTSYYHKQIQPLGWNLNGSADELLRVLAQERLVFIQTPIDETSLSQKTNQFEAEVIVDVISRFKVLFKNSGRQPSPNDIGIITPFRAQIARITQSITENGLAELNITIDTVERYQGGARNIILISLCTNNVDKLNTLTSYSDEGIDRKLNVSLTRARDQIVLIGNKGVLAQNQLYQTLLEHYKEISYEVIQTLKQQTL